MQKEPDRLTSILWMMMMFLCVIVVSLVVYLWAEKEIRENRLQIKNMRQSYMTGQKDLIRTQVLQAVDAINHEKSKAIERIRHDVRSRTYQAWQTATYLYDRYKSQKSPEELRQLVHDALFAWSWDEGKGYYFAQDIQEIIVLNRNYPELEGKSGAHLQDSKGQYVSKVIAAAVQTPDKEGFCTYYWTKPEAPGTFVPKISFVKYFEPFGWIIGNGKYTNDEIESIKQEVIQRIEHFKYGDNGYLFAATWEGLSLTGPLKGLNTINVTDPNGVKIVQELITAAKSGGGFVEYVAPKYKDRPPSAKISYAAPVPDWQWYIGTGLHIDQIETIVRQKKQAAEKALKNLILKSCIVLLLFVLISFLIVWTLSQKIKKNIDIFERFFHDSAHKATPIDESGVSFSEFKSLARLANQMSEKRLSSEAALIESERKYRLLFKHAPTGIYEVDFIKGRFTTANDIMCSFSGYTEEEFLAMNPMALFTAESNAHFKILIKKLTRGEPLNETIEADLIRKSGDTVHIIMAIDYQLEDKILKSARVIVHDITELKRVEAEKIRAEKLAGEQKKLAMVGQIAGKMAHDFNNILGIIMGNSELLLTEKHDLPTTERLKLILNQTLRGKNLTRNLVAFAKDQEPKQEFFKLADKIDLVINLMKKDLEGIKLIRNDDFDIPDLLADPGMIEHTIVNLLQNSIHALSLTPMPEIEIKTFCLNDFIILQVRDNGCGIPEEHHKSIYSPAFTLKGSKDITRSYGNGIKGTGYGMANVKKYIEQHKGSILLESKPGKGTRFTIHLPVIKKELTENEKEIIEKKNIKSGKRILLVEDETDISNVQYTILSNPPCSHTVDIAHNGQMAIDLLKRNTYDTISLDYLLPGEINGMDVYEFIRETSPGIPILFISGNIEFLESIRELKARDPMIDHISKPCLNRNYIEQINALLSRNAF